MTEIPEFLLGPPGTPKSVAIREWMDKMYPPTRWQRIVRWYTKHDRLPMYTKLTIPGTHGTWPKRFDWCFERGGFYVILTRTTTQRTLIWTWRKADPYSHYEEWE